MDEWTAWAVEVEERIESLLSSSKAQPDEDEDEEAMARAVRLQVWAVGRRLVTSHLSSARHVEKGVPRIGHLLSRYSASLSPSAPSRHLVDAAATATAATATLLRLDHRVALSSVQMLANWVQLRASCVAFVLKSWYDKQFPFEDILCSSAVPLALKCALAHVLHVCCSPRRAGGEEDSSQACSVLAERMVSLVPPFVDSIYSYSSPHKDDRDHPQSLEWKMFTQALLKRVLTTNTSCLQRLLNGRNKVCSAALLTFVAQSMTDIGDWNLAAVSNLRACMLFIVQQGVLAPSFEYEAISSWPCTVQTFAKLPQKIPFAYDLLLNISECFSSALEQALKRNDEQDHCESETFALLNALIAAFNESEFELVLVAALRASTDMHGAERLKMANTPVTYSNPDFHETETSMNELQLHVPDHFQTICLSVLSTMASVQTNLSSSKKVWLALTFVSHLHVSSTQPLIREYAVLGLKAVGQDLLVQKELRSLEAHAVDKQAWA